MRNLNLSAAAAVIGISPSLLHYRANMGKLRVARWQPMQFRAADVLAYARTAPIPNGSRGRPRGTFCDAIARLT